MLKYFWLLFKKFSLKVFLKHDSVDHNEPVPELNTCQSHFRVSITDSLDEYLEIEARFVGFNDKIRLFGENFCDT
jgi:hypothetical protein